MYRTCMESALLFTILLVVAGSVCGGLLNAWGVLLRLVRVERAVVDLQNSILSEIKKRAGREGLDKRAEANRNIALARELQVAGPVSKNEQPEFKKWW